MAELVVRMITMMIHYQHHHHHGDSHVDINDSVDNDMNDIDVVDEDYDRSEDTGHEKMKKFETPKT